MNKVSKTALSSVLATVLLFAISTETYAKQSKFSKKDANADGQLSLQEYTGKAKKPENAAKRFAKLDVDGNGSLSEKEFAAQKKKSKKSKKK
jgi:hypothetical protein